MKNCKRKHLDYVFVNHIKEYRIAKGITQEELGALVGCSRNTIASLERGDSEPSAYIACLLAEALDTKFEILFELRKIEE